MGHRRILCLGEGSVLLIVLCGSLCAVQRRARQHAAGRRWHGSSLTGTRNCWWPPAAGFRIGPALRGCRVFRTRFVHPFRHLSTFILRTLQCKCSSSCFSFSVSS